MTHKESENMKKIIAFLLAFSMVLAFAACDIGNDVSRPENSGASTEVSGEAGNESEVSEAAIDTDADGMRIIPIPTDEYDGTLDIKFSDGVAFAQYANAGLDSFSATFVAYTLADGKRTGVLELGEGEWTIVVQSGRLYVLDAASRHMRIYDKSLILLTEYDLPASDDIYFAVSADGRYILIFGSKPILCNASDGSDTKRNITTSVRSGYAFGDKFVITAGDDFVALGREKPISILDPATGAITYCGDERTLKINAPYLTETWNDGIIFTEIGSGKRRVIHQPDEREYIVDCDDGTIVTVVDGLYRIYRTETSEYLTLDLTGHSFGCAAENGYFYAADSAGVHVVDLSKAKYTACRITEADENTDIHGMYEPYRDGTEEVEIAKRVLEKYGVRIIFESNNFVNGCFSYEVSAAPEEDWLPTAKTIEEFLSLIPEGLMREVGDGQEVWIYLCRDIHDDAETYAGFAMHVSQHPFIAVDSSFRGDAAMAVLSHEAGHVFNFFLSMDNAKKWEEATPSEYYGEDDVKHTIYDNDTSDVWFVSSYARTNVEEDRADTFSAMFMAAYRNESSAAFMYQNIMNKFKIYAEILRETYVCCKNASELFWEKFVK